MWYGVVEWGGHGRGRGGVNMVCGLVSCGIQMVRRGRGHLHEKETLLGLWWPPLQRPAVMLLLDNRGTAVTSRVQMVSRG